MGSDAARADAAPGVVVLGGAHGALAVVRSLGRQGVAASFVTSDHPIAGYSRYAARTLRWSGPDHAQALETLLSLGASGTSRPVLIPCGDAEAQFISRNHARLASSFRLTTEPWGLAQWAYDKQRTYARAAALGLDFPKIHAVDSPEAAERLECRFPLVLKPAMRERANAFTLAKAWRVDDRAALAARYRQAAALVGPDRIVVQEMIPGSGLRQFSYAALCEHGRPLAALTARRRRQFPVEFGYTSTFVEVVEEPAVEAAARRFLESLDFTGLVEIEFKYDERDRRYKLLDVNARPWTWIGLGAAAGIDFPYLAWRLAMGETVPECRARPGAAWIHLSRDLVAAAAEIWASRLSPEGYVKSLRKPLTFAAFAKDDPAPGLLDLPLLAGRVLTRRAPARIRRAAESLLRDPTPAPGAAADGTATSPAVPDQHETEGQADRAPRSGINKMLIRTVLNALYFSGAQYALRPLVGGVGVILTLHHVRPPREGAFQPNRLLEVTPEFLEDLVRSLRREGVELVSLDDLHRRLSEGDLGRRFAALTFDDGYCDNLAHAYPILKRYGVPFALYVPTRFPEGRGDLWWRALERVVAGNDSIEAAIGGRRLRLPSATAAEKTNAYEAIYWRLRALPTNALIAAAVQTLCERHGVDTQTLCREECMTWDEIATLAADPLITIGAHTVNHVMLRKESEEAARREMRDSAAILAERLGRRVRHFSYPVGDATSAGEREFRIAAELGFATAVTTRPALIFPSDRERLTALPRISVNGEFQRLRYMRTLMSGVPTALLNGLRRPQPA